MPKPFLRPPQCALLVVLDAIAGTWPMMVMATLWEGPMRFNELRRVVGASQKMLTQTLRHLEAQGLVSRTVTPCVPPQVEYAATPLGLSLGETIGGLRRWSDEHVGEMRAPRGPSGGSEERRAD